VNVEVAVDVLGERDGWTCDSLACIRLLSTSRNHVRAAERDEKPHDAV
jgi:hypothetical protein